MALLSNTNIQIPFFLIFYAYALSDIITSNFILYRACYVILDNDETKCSLLGTQNQSNEIQRLEEDVQPTASVVMLVKSVISAIPPIFLSFIVGPWSSKHGRKPILLSCLAGLFLMNVTAICISAIKSASPWWWIFGETASSLGGGFCSILTVSYCYVADTTTPAQRIYKMAMLELYLGVGTAAGTLTSSLIFDKTGYIGVYSVCAGATLAAFLFTKFILVESINVVEKGNKIQDLFDLSAILTTLRVFFKSRPNKKRMLLYLFFLLTFLYIFVNNGESSTFFLFLRKKFQWPLNLYTWFSGINTVVEILATVFVLVVICKMLHVRDTTVIMYGFIMETISAILYALAEASWVIFVGSALKRSTIALLPLGRTAVSKLIPSQDLGCIFAVYSSSETIAQLISTFLYTLFYNATLSSYPGAYNYLSAGIYGCGILLTGGIMYLRKKQEITETHSEDIEENTVQSE